AADAYRGGHFAVVGGADHVGITLLSGAVTEAGIALGEHVNEAHEDQEKEEEDDPSTLQPHWWILARPFSTSCFLPSRHTPSTGINTGSLGRSHNGPRHS